MTDKWKRHSSQRDNIEIYSHICCCLQKYPTCYSYNCITCKRILNLTCYTQESISNCKINSNENDGTKKSPLLYNHREDKISLNFRKVSKFLYRLTETKAPKSSRTYSYQSLFCLIVNRCVLNKIFAVSKIIINALIDIIQFAIRICSYPIHTDHSKKSYEKSCKEVTNASSSYEVETKCEWCKEQNSSEVRLQCKKTKYYSEINHIRYKSFTQISNRL